MTAAGSGVPADVVVVRLVNVRPITSYRPLLRTIAPHKTISNANLLHPSNEEYYYSHAPTPLIFDHYNDYCFCYSRCYASSTSP